MRCDAMRYDVRDGTHMEQVMREVKFEWGGLGMVPRDDFDKPNYQYKIRVM